MTMTAHLPPVTTLATTTAPVTTHARTGRGIGGHHSARAKSTTWLTPPHVLEALGDFDLDPCAAPGWRTAAEHYVLPVDGLTQPWAGRVWLNPPYGAQTWRWLDRLAEHGDGVALIFARTETAGFVEQVWSKADGVFFLHGRLHFHRGDGSRAQENAGAPSCLVAYGQANADVLASCALPGTWVPLRTPSPVPHM